MPIGTSLELTASKARAMEGLLLGIPGVERVYTIVGHEGHSNLARFRVRVIDKSSRDEPLSFYQDAFRHVLGLVPGAEASISKPGLIEGLGDWPPLMLIVRGEDLDTLMVEGERLKRMLEEVPGSSDVRLSMSPGRPELRIDIDRAVAADRGIPAGVVALTARMLVDGAIASTLRDGGPEADIRVRAASRFASDQAAIAQLPLPSPRGLVTLGEVARFEMGAGPSEIQRTDRLRSVTLSSQITTDAALGDVLTAFQGKLASAPLPDSYFLSVEGQAKDMAETSEAMGLAMVVAMTFIFMVLASQFESLIHPFTLLVSVPLAMVGAVLALFVTGHSFSMGSQIGMILLMGLVTKNAILLVDGALAHMRDGHDALAAIRYAGPRRMRPIVMTSAAMVFGMLPTALGTGVGAEFRAPMGVVVIGGVISSTLLTLLVVPVVFLWVEKQRDRAGRAWAWVNRPRVPAPMPAEDVEAAK
jgi:multidrug efflux pump subunit AcrB